MKYKRSFGSHLFDFMNVALISVFLLTIIYPFLNIIAISFSNQVHVALNDITVFPKGFTFSSYAYVFRDPSVFRGYLNSILYAGVGTFFSLLFTSLMAYPLTVPEFLGKKFITIFLTITMFFGGGMIPTYLLVRNLSLLNTLWIMVLPGCVGAYNVCLFRTFFQNLPKELREAAVLDGANDLDLLFRIVIPLSLPLIATFALFGIVGSWNSWFNALIYLNDQNRFPVQLILRNYLYQMDAGTLQQMGGNGGGGFNMMQRGVTPQSIRMAMVVVTMFPIMMIYPFFQKYFVKGVVVGAIKG